jgi:hypothetical protein
MLRAENRERVTNGRACSDENTTCSEEDTRLLGSMLAQASARGESDY